ncbi:MAG TPA: T9SS type A sorting domain-containing protein [Saprospiraceae bacterium]|nr:T9SS type A sorting domain-containing protein [Saprospiraceae bacterium]HMP25943.1 T9SS type A sorting domain-containing protein [Saprospiraceae bacterium]
MMHFTQSGFKKHFFLLGFLLLSNICSNVLVAQTTHTLTVETPESIAGEYPAQMAVFGACIQDVQSLSGELILTQDNLACNAVTNDLTGKIAVIDRGTCGFSIKVLNAQQRGAIAVIIVNNTAAAPAVFTMAGTPPSSEMVTIPSFMISLASGNTIKAQIANGVNVRLVLNDAFTDAGETVIWGNNPGEGDFDGGLNEWTVANSSCANGANVQTWNWRATSDARGSCGPGSLLSPSSCNGAMSFESNFLDNGDRECGAAGGGSCTARQYGELISPVIDLSGSNSAAYVLLFHQNTRQFRSNYYVAWSTNAGTSWDSVQINQDVPLNESKTGKMRVPLPGTGGASSLQIRFIYDANYYYWIIDDVKIAELEANNLSVNTFFAVPPNAATPLAHVEPVGFLADIENVGAVTQTNVNLNVTIRDADENEVFTADLPYGSVPAGALVENIPFQALYTPTSLGAFRGTYTITADAEDFDLGNNTRDFDFVITEGTFSKDLTGVSNATRPADAGWDANEPHSWAWGVGYYIPEGAGNFVRTISFAIQPENAGAVGKDILITMYKWVDTNEDLFAQPNERELVGFNNYTITGNEMFSQLITLPFPDPQDDPVQLEDNTQYIVMVEYLADDASNVFISYNNEIDYTATVAVLGDVINRNRFAGFLGIGGNLFEEIYFPFGFTGSAYSNIPVVRMTVGSSPSSTEDLNRLASNFNIYPNPTNGLLNLQLDLDKPAKDATVRIFDISGRLLQQWRYDNVQREQMQYAVNQLSSGTYFIQLITEDGAGTKKFMVTK